MLVVQCNISFCDMPVTDKLAKSSHFIYKHVDCTGAIDILKISPQSPHVHKHLQLPYLLIMRPSDVSFVLSCSCSCESWPGNAWSHSSVLRQEFKRLYQLFLCALFVGSRKLLVVVDFIPKPCEHYLVSFVSKLRWRSCFAFWKWTMTPNSSWLLVV